MNLILIILLIFIVLGGGFGYHSGWYAGSPWAGYGTGGIGLVVIILLILAFTGRL